jgi:hypothetical protein
LQPDFWEGFDAKERRNDFVYNLFLNLERGGGNQYSVWKKEKRHQEEGRDDMNVR